MFTVYYKNGKVYLVFSNEDEADAFYEVNELHGKAWITSFGSFCNAIEMHPIIDAAAEHKAALAHGKAWDNDQATVHPLGADA